MAEKFPQVFQAAGDSCSSLTLKKSTARDRQKRRLSLDFPDMALDRLFPGPSYSWDIDPFYGVKVIDPDYTMYLEDTSGYEQAGREVQQTLDKVQPPGQVGYSRSRQNHQGSAACSTGDSVSKSGSAKNVRKSASRKTGRRRAKDNITYFEDSENVCDISNFSVVRAGTDLQMANVYSQSERKRGSKAESVVASRPTLKIPLQKEKKQQLSRKKKTTKKNINYHSDNLFRSSCKA
ncbi:hypothetical protein SK128_005845 [Halocaridina rubra]|uniref:Uncharacterized protein n=1 Tax=Halocaridina rubra TaxID=373956 RepID=A0AAN9A1B6_HALRR